MDSKWKQLQKELKRRWPLYLLLLPALLYILIFAYGPMYGVLIAFKDYKASKGIMGSNWVGLKHFIRFLNYPDFMKMIRNTLGISVYSLATFPIPVIIALLINELTGRFKKVVQMVTYAPYFLSTVVVCGMLVLLTGRDGPLGMLYGAITGTNQNLLLEAGLFRHIYVWSGVWQGIGWNAIIYLSALAGVDQEMHEAAIIDGATKIQRMRYIDIPSIKGTIIMLLILRMGGIMNVGFEKVYLLQNDLNYNASIIISTYVYESGLLRGDYAFSTAVGLFNNVINIILMVCANTFSKKVLDDSLF